MSEIEKLVQAMHDTVCRCGDWCLGAERDHQDLIAWVEAQWGSAYPFEGYLKGIRNASPHNE